jgi:hypothetical protein
VKAAVAGGTQDTTRDTGDNRVTGIEREMKMEEEKKREREREKRV